MRCCTVGEWFSTKEDKESLYQFSSRDWHVDGWKDIKFLLFLILYFASYISFPVIGLIIIFTGYNVFGGCVIFVSIILLIVIHKAHRKGIFKLTLNFL